MTVILPDIRMATGSNANCCGIGLRRAATPTTARFYTEDRTHKDQRPLNEQHRPTIRKFNPGLFQSDQEVIAQFAVRQIEFKTVLEIIGENLDSPSWQHVLVVAPRGLGKTMLLARLAAECRISEKPSRRIVPVRLMEECYEIFTLADFWLEALIGLAKEIATSDPNTSQELKKAHAEFKSRWRERDIAEHARAAVMSTAERLDWHLVLMVENLQSLVETVDDYFGWGLRHALQIESRLTLVATATSYFRALGDVEHAFFELFRPVRLDPLDSKSCHRLWHELGGGKRSEAEIEPIRILTGGSPRLLAMTASFANRLSSERLLDEFVDLIDGHTEYFRGHLDGMPKTERRVYLALADLWQPSRTGEVASRASLGIRTVSTMLGRLADRGAVLVGGTSSKREYSVAEGLYCLYYKLRRDQGAAQIVCDLIRFMRLVFTEHEQKQAFGTLHLESPMHHALRHGFQPAVPHEPIIADLIPNELQIDDGPSDPEDTPTGGISAIEGIEAAFNKLDFEKAIVLADLALEEWTDPSGAGEELIALRVLVRKAQALQRSTYFQAAAETCRVALKRFSKSPDPEIQSHVAVARIVKFASEVKEGNSEAASETFREFRSQFSAEAFASTRKLAQEMLDAAFHLFCGNQREESTRILNEFTSRFSGQGYPADHSIIASFYIGQARSQQQSGLLEDAISTCNEAIARFKDEPESAARRSIAYALTIKASAYAQLKRSADAIKACDEMAACFVLDQDIVRPIDFAFVMSIKLSELMRTERYAEAIATCDQVFERIGADASNSVRSLVASALSDKVIALSRMEKFAEMIPACDLLEKEFGTETADTFGDAISIALLCKATTQIASFKFEEAIRTCETISRRFGSSANPRIARQVILAAILQASALVDIERANSALRKCDDIDDMFSKTYEQMRSFDFRLLFWVRFKVHALLEDHASARVALQSAISKYDLDDDGDVQELLRLIVDALAQGTPEQYFLEFFAGDRNLSERLAPIHVALKRRANQTARAPVEVVAVADRIRKMIEDRQVAILEWKSNRVCSLRRSDVASSGRSSAQSVPAHAFPAN